MHFLKNYMQNEFLHRHIGLTDNDTNAMLTAIGVKSLDDLISKTLPSTIYDNTELNIANGKTEHEVITYAKELSEQNQVFKTYIGRGYYPSITPSVIKLNILQNPSWYTAYTPYQAEISQGRLQMLLNFQQMVTDLTGMEISNASLLDEPTAVAEAMMLARRVNGKNSSNRLFVDKHNHLQTITVLTTRAKPLGIELIIDDMHNTDFDDFFACVLPQINTLGKIDDLTKITKKAQDKNVINIITTDLLALTIIKTPKEMGADIVVGNSQRFGVPLGFGGPHAAFLATKGDYKRHIPGRIIGVSKDIKGSLALRMALQTREQHIRRDKATSNICTAQVLLAIIAVAYAIYHGKEGLISISRRIAGYTNSLKLSLEKAKVKVLSGNFFDTITLVVNNADTILKKAQQQQLNLGKIDKTRISIALNETTTYTDLEQLAQLFNAKLTLTTNTGISKHLVRTSDFLTHLVFHNYRSETEMMRYLNRLEKKDIALNNSMIALGSCTMKLNSATQMQTISLPGFANLHPYVPKEQTKGYQQLCQQLAEFLMEITGYDAISLQPNAGSQGELAGLLAIKHYHQAKGDNKRQICLIPTSAHGTNPASSVLAGMQVQIVNCDDKGNIDISDLTKKLESHSAEIAAIMITYPSTFGVFEANIKEVCALVHKHGGQVYLDGANLNAMVGLAKVGQFGADVSHINLHKTFSIPHGGGGPGMGPIGVKAHLADFLPGDPLITNSGAISGANFGSAGILPISWAYMQLLGGDGMTYASKIAILNANYIARQLADDYPILYTGEQGLVAHECILDLRPLKSTSGITEVDIAKRLIDYGFHAPTMSFPVAGTLMVEPTESESKAEIDRFIAAMKQIKQEINSIINGSYDKHNNPLKNAPHTIDELVLDWQYPYSREQAVYPLKSLKNKQYFPPVKRVDDAYGDKNLFCQCPDVSDYQ